MDHLQETAALREIQQRLAERFPHVAPEVVEAAVRLAHSELSGPVRDYVPVLVEHAARDRLAAIAVAVPEADTTTPQLAPAS